MIQRDKSLTCVFGALLLFVMVCRLPTSSGEVRASFMVIMHITLTLALAAVLWKFANKYMAVFLVLLTVSTFYPWYGQHAFNSWHMVVLGMLWYFLLVHFVNDVDVLLDAMCYGAIICLIVQCVQATKIPFLIKCPIPVGLMASKNETSALYIFCIAAFFRPKWIRAIPLMLFGVYLSKSAMGYVCLWAGGCMILFFKTLYGKSYNHIAYIMLMAGILAMFVAPFIVRTESLNFRVLVWVDTFKTLKQHWIMGCGLGHWKVLFPNAMFADGKRWMTAHNEFYQLWAECGVLPFIPLGLYFVDIWRKWKPELLTVTIAAAIGMIAVNCFGNFALHIAPLAMIVLTWLSIIQIQTNKQTKKEKFHGVRISTVFRVC